MLAQVIPGGVPDPPPSSRAKASAADIVIPSPPETDFWSRFGLLRHGDGNWLLPEGIVGFEAASREAHPALIDCLKQMGVPSHLAFWTGERRVALYRLDAHLLTAMVASLPDGVELIAPGRPVELPASHEIRTSDFIAKTAADLSILTAANIERKRPAPPATAPNSNPLLPHSLRGQSEHFKRLAIEAKPLLGEVCLQGQVTIWYAAPNTGKTLIALSLFVEAVREHRIDPDFAFYVNADDNANGFATKLQLMDDLGAHTLAPNFKGFQASEFIALLHTMADKDEARGVLIIIDTVKKFASLMDKRESSEFAHACRRVAMMGGTVLGLAHTTKNSNADGTPRYAGTSDLVDDTDAAYTINLIEGGHPGERVAEFRCFKARGDCAESAAYAFSIEKGLQYEEKLASVRVVDATQLDEFRRVETERSDAEVTAVVADTIRKGISTKMFLAKEVAKQAGISERAALKVIERYTGDDPETHRWKCKRRARGALVFELLDDPAPT